MSAHLHLNQTLRLTARDLNQAGEGVASAPNGQTLFVPGLLPGETAPVRVTTLRSRWGRGQLIGPPESPSEARTSPPCTVYERCGGCTLQHLDYSAQLHWKAQQVRACLQRIGGFGVETLDAAAHPIAGMQTPWAYRSKIAWPVRALADGRVGIGFYEAGSHRLVEPSTCLIQPPVADRIRKTLLAFIQAQGIAPYNEAENSGFLREVVLRLAFATHQIQLILVTTQAESLKTAQARWQPLLSTLSAELEAENWQLTSVHTSVVSGQTNRILGTQTQCIAGQETITERLDDLSYEISPLSFFQVNPIQAEKLFERVVDWADLRESDQVLDFYCGTGSISLFLARKSHHVLGVEVIAAAVENAQKNAALNGLSDRTTFFVGTAEAVAPTWLDRGVNPHCVVVDPPRKGCDEQLLETLLTWQAPRLIYVSCNPATLARDLKILAQGGYQLKAYQPFDLFPQTTHVETVCLMTRVK